MRRQLSNQAQAVIESDSHKLEAGAPRHATEVDLSSANEEGKSFKRPHADYMYSAAGNLPMNGDITDHRLGTKSNLRWRSNAAALSSSVPSFEEEAYHQSHPEQCQVTTDQEIELLTLLKV